ncbi:UDP-forming cellulose synthase catalytic subunit [Hafnia alvei]|uniref:UDP-forming cellulose synthase catalytic subunit n=1 Tax=Hafnia alvei TaxID=569 RepID=UPI001412FC69|nr:UDP-forming cellulose synthase catalytic subunit [Hafnia alvei]QIP54760.1 UDP-forming cellulose synthase catalytic subunit [Hafnia alvei]
MKRTLISLLSLLILLPISVLIIFTPMSAHKQFIFGLMMIGVLFILGRSQNKKISTTLVVLSLLMATRYIYWRATSTLSFNSWIEAVLGWGLFVAEIYAWLIMVLGYMQTIWPLERQIEPLPDDMSLWPTVDVYVPTYNESLDIVRDTVLAAQCIDYPADKLKIYILDDGKRSEFAVFAAEANVGYITRSDNAHAKAGNLNKAMAKTHGELICIFDCDHVATRGFLQATVGSFLRDKKLALIQTPHYFYSKDPFERNLPAANDAPNEGMLFYGPVQKGNDNWNATFFCGSCAVIRREALEEIGGFAVETVTEDAHTALKMQRLGWGSAFLGLRLSAGLATERLTLHVIQRTRWARGMTQILRLDNPLFGRGLKWQQRLCYLNAILHFQYGLPRIAFLTAPLAYLLLNQNIIASSASMIFAYSLPHLVMATVLNSRLNGRYRFSFWGEVYETVMCFHLVIPTLLTLISPRRGKFNVTDKGDTLDQEYFDKHIVMPHIITAVLVFCGVIAGLARFFSLKSLGIEPYVLLLNVAWAVYSLLILLASIAVANESKQVRKSIRIDIKIPAVVHFSNGASIRTETRDLSMGGVQLVNPSPALKDHDVEAVELLLNNSEVCIPAVKVFSNDHSLRLQFGDVGLHKRRELVRVVLARADAWLDTPHAPDRLSHSMKGVISSAARLWGIFWRGRQRKRAEKELAKQHATKPQMTKQQGHSEVSA